MTRDEDLEVSQPSPMQEDPARTDREHLLDSALRLPEHVVYRNFAAETVFLNLDTAQYHGLNPIGGYMLRVLDGAATVRAAIDQIAARYDQDPSVVEEDVVALARDLLERGLVERVVETPLA